ncbi:hypothetical protein A1Q2_01638 [Trichosporon asahii var. asahii CBS 8904]|uniref:Uncharacterized protein n=1 Tax=Trichosporon asahii var. asahii (strain CBS 8904) TaxID=1220162 RepID=K1VIW6_TRIAC|nr:hypothetical protein A1Q2_01638 [Trichosporon asahii var. asahii CBS 8904]
MPAEPIPIASQENSQQFPSLSTSHPIFGRWSAFSPKSPSQTTGMSAGSPPNGSFHDDDDIGDLRSHTWAHAAAQRGQRRAASMSMSAGSSLLGSQLGSGSVGSPPSGGPLSDKVALGQGVLRRLSFSNGFGAGGRVSQACPSRLAEALFCAPEPQQRQASLTSDVGMLRRARNTQRSPSGLHGHKEVLSGTNLQPQNVPPPVPSPPNPTPIGSLKPNDGLAAHPPPPPADANVQRAGTIAGSRRRFSESTARRRGVSPVSFEPFAVELELTTRWASGSSATRSTFKRSIRQAFLRRTSPDQQAAPIRGAQTSCNDGPWAPHAPALVAHH